jgi:hypothetical protein
VRIVLTALVVAALAVTTPAVAGPPRCDRACVIAVADTYLAALVSHDGSHVAATKDVVRVENGSQSANGDADLRAGLASPIMFVITGIRELEWDVSGNVAVASYLMDTVTSPTYIVERFALQGRLIHRIDANFYIDAPGYVQGPESFTSRPEGQQERLTAYNHGPAGPVPMPGNHGDVAKHPRAAGCDNTCVTRAGQGLLSAFASHRLGAVRLAPNAELLVNRRSTATGAAQVRAALQSAKVTAVKDVRLIADGTTASGVYDALLGTRRSHAALRLTMAGTSIVRIAIVCDDAVSCLS